MAAVKVAAVAATAVHCWVIGMTHTQIYTFISSSTLFFTCQRYNIIALFDDVWRFTQIHYTLCASNHHRRTAHESYQTVILAYVDRLVTISFMYSSLDLNIPRKLCGSDGTVHGILYMSSHIYLIFIFVLYWLLNVELINLICIVNSWIFRCETSFFFCNSSSCVPALIAISFFFIQCNGRVFGLKKGKKLLLNLLFAHPCSFFIPNYLCNRDVAVNCRTVCFTVFLLCFTSDFIWVNDTSNSLDINQKIISYLNIFYQRRMVAWTRCARLRKYISNCTFVYFLSLSLFCYLYLITMPKWHTISYEYNKVKIYTYNYIAHSLHR